MDENLILQNFLQAQQSALPAANPGFTANSYGAPAAQGGWMGALETHFRNKVGRDMTPQDRQDYQWGFDNAGWDLQTALEHIGSRPDAATYQQSLLPGAGQSLSPGAMQYMAQQEPSASGWSGGGVTLGDSTVAPVGNIQTSSDGSITSPGVQGYVSQNNAQSQQDNIYDPNAVANLYGQDGAYQSSFTPEDPYKMDPQEMLILAALAAGGGATMMGLGGGGLGLGNSALGSLGGLGGVAEAGTIGFGGAGSLSGAAGGLGSLGLETVSEGFGPAFESWASGVPQGWQLPLETASEGFGPAYESWASTVPQGWQLPPGVPPPANPFAPNAPTSNRLLDKAGNFLTNPKNLAGIASTVLGGVAGATSGGGAGGSGAGGSGNTLDARLEPYVYGSGGLMPQTKGLLDMQMPQAQSQAAQLASAGTGLLGQSVAGNGVGAVQMGAPGTAVNPYLNARADDIQKRTQELLAQNNLSIQGSAVAAGGLGGSRMGVAQGLAAGKAADYLQGNLANMYGQAWEGDANRSLGKYTADLGFYGQQRQQDLAGAQTGANMLGLSQQQAWNPLGNASDIYKGFSGLNSASDKSGGWSGALGGLLGGAGFASKMGWFS